MSVVRAIEEEYWTVQYQTGVSGYSEPQFWPPDGEGKHNTPEDAESDAKRFAGQTRILHITRRVEYGEPMTRVDDDHD